MKSASWVPLFLCLAALPGHSATVDITVKDARGASVEDAVVWLMPKAGNAPARRRESAIEQKNKEFIPLVSVVQTGTAVQFPNRDEIRHHVYSFSPPKVFELKLYAGTPAAPILFDKAGEVVLGCNIHDHMLAYVYVVDTPWFAKSGKLGEAKIDNVPAGEYDLHLWHYAQASPQPPQSIRLRGDENQPSSFAVPLKSLPPRPTPK